MYKHTLNLIKNKILVYITMEELKGIQSLTPLSRAFFSKQNISSLHTNIRYQVWLDTNKQHVISAQSNEELILIMRSIYLQNSENQPDHILNQVKVLNQMVLDYAVQKIITGLKQHLDYVDHISNKREILPHSVNISNKGSKQLMIKPWF
tara:strand:- start:25 stop:474 length:450 start_codon:yes stop_codon:yes gene_type:complete